MVSYIYMACLMFAFPFALHCWNKVGWKNQLSRMFFLIMSIWTWVLGAQVFGLVLPFK